MIIFIIFYILLIFYIFLPNSPLYRWNYLTKDYVILKKNKRGSYDKEMVKNGEPITAVETGRLDLIIIDVDKGTPFWKLYEMNYYKHFNDNPYVVQTVNGGRHFYYSYSKSIKAGLDKVFRKCHISCGGVIGLDILVSDTYGIIPPTSLQTEDGRKIYKWLKKRYDFRDTSILPSIPEKIIDMLNYLGRPEFNYRFYGKYNGLNYGDMYKFKKESRNKNILVIFWSDEIKDYIKSRYKGFQGLYYEKKRLGEYVKIGNKIFFNSDFHFKLLPSKLFDKYVIHLFNIFKVEIYISVQTGGTKNKYEMGCIRQSNEVYIYDDSNISKLNYEINNRYEFAPLAPLAYVGKFSDIPKEPENGIITSDAAFSLFSCASSYKPKCNAYSLSIITDYVGEDINFGKTYKATRFLFGKFLDKFLIKIVGN